MNVAQLATFTSTLLNTAPFTLPIHLRQVAPQRGASTDAVRFHRLRFGQSFDGISLPARSLGRACYRDEGALNRHLEDYMSRLQALYPDRLEDQVADVIGRTLPTGECSLELVAATLNRPPRTLQAHLALRGFSYREMSRQMRYSLATQRLTEGNVSITDLSLQLGDAEVSIFSRHFKAWTGVSPRTWRAARLVHAKRAESAANEFH
ncbi:MAG: helix-turn-helix transcriptional regulator [Halioglobus sp.]|nr:helix-turn-helix transcriptional regulator [Halioglobus sp.]